MPPVPHKRLTRVVTTDVLVIGAGITGAMLADELTQAGLHVVVADRRGPARGSTTASTALTQYELDTPLTKLARMIGKRNAMRAWRRSRLAVDAIGARLRELGVPDMIQRDALYLAGDELNATSLKREHDARRAAGLMVTYLDRKALHKRFGIARPAAILGYGDIAINPRKATAALLDAAIERGARIFAPADIVDIDSGWRSITATTANDKRIRCRHLVFATGYEFPKDVPMRGHQIVSTWAIATVRQPRKLWPEQCMVWEASDPYLYMRTTPDGRVICGGEDEEFSDAATRDALIGAKTSTLRRKLGALFPQLDTTPDFVWAGSFGATTTGLPTIGRVPGMRNCWAALGYGGNGTTYARIAADVITGALAGRPDADADLYAFPR